MGKQGWDLSVMPTQAKVPWDQRWRTHVVLYGYIYLSSAAYLFIYLAYLGLSLSVEASGRSYRLCNGWNRMESNMWFPYVWYCSIYSIPDIVVDLSSCGSSYQPPLDFIMYVRLWVKKMWNVHSVCVYDVILMHPNTKWHPIVHNFWPESYGSWSKVGHGIGDVYYVTCQQNVLQCWKMCDKLCNDINQIRGKEETVQPAPQVLRNLTSTSTICWNNWK